MNEPIDEETAWRWIDEYYPVAAGQLDSSNDKDLTPGVWAMVDMAVSVLDHDELVEHLVDEYGNCHIDGMSNNE